ncbi:transcriptional regulator [Candidatus Nitrososphaera evergladensis SR1]|uniref:Transcriptional regulator n=1 Tax=Candidatus Nitrososphaera evergladensis SR1 TaxID=1459636 RepID=A0A075MSA1_9ARCH|nr:Lrp/AsnC family transcriptional regulator [Candidatus Nitrososphaera evergladensis]AIF84446.1 transcriptional regulator [Candidatus Nitrososphaera evergladensis SR1]
MKRENDSSAILKNPFVDQGMLEGRQEDVADMIKHETSPFKKATSRDEILAEFREMGVTDNVFSSVPTNTLARLLENIKTAATEQRYPKVHSGGPSSPPILSTVDKKILKALLSSTGGVSSLTLSKELDIPLSTVQRRRKRLEANLLEMSYTLKVERFGWRTATLFISTRNGMTAAVGKEILSLSDGVKSVNRILGENSADLMVEIIFRNNAELLNMVEKMKSINGVGNVFWIELIEPMGKNTDFAERVIEAD